MKRVLVRALALALVATLALLSGGCRKTAEVGTEGRLEPVGSVLLTKRGDEPVTVSGQRTLRPGDVIEVAEGGATVVLPSGASLELRPRAVVSFDDGPELRTGDLLVVAQRAPQAVRSAGSTVRTTGVSRLTQSLSLRVASYLGSVVLESGVQSIDVPALRQVAVPAIGVLPGAPSPLAVAADDVWDKRFLAGVLEATEPLERLSRGFTGQVVGEGRTVGFYRDLVPALASEPAFQQVYVDQVGDPGEVLLATTIALLGRRGAFADRLTGAATFRAEGAPWALVALDQDVPSFALLRRALEDAIGRAPLQLAAPVAPVVVPPAASGPATVRRSRPTPTPSPTPTPTPTTPPQAPAPSPPPNGTPPTDPAPPGGPLAPIVDPVVALLDGLLGGG